jgi:ABC-type lipoprotein release transport system permease subunit
MKAYDMMELAGRNLREAILRNSLTTIGISVGVASLVAMLSLGAGLQRLAGRQLGRSGLFDTVIVNSKQDFRSMEDRRENKNVKQEDMKTLDEAARHEMEKLPGVAEVYPDIRLVAEVHYAPTADKPDKSHFIGIAGLPSSAKGSEVFDEVKGGFFSGPEADECIIISEFGRELLDMPEISAVQKNQLSEDEAKKLLGKEVTLRYAERQTSQADGKNGTAKNEPPPADLGDPMATMAANFSVVSRERKLRIVGIVNSEPYGGSRGGFRTRLWLPTELADKLNMIQPSDLRTMLRPAQGKRYFTLVVRAKASRQVPTIQDAIKKMGFSTFSLQDASKGINRFFLFLDMFLAIFGSLALAVASLGIINTLVMAILERRREIGIMKALGASDFDVKKLFFVEAGAMGALGGLLGVGLGWSIGKIINFGTNIYLQRNEIPPESFWYVPWWLIAGALGFSVIVSLAAGLYPASRAAKLDPVQALRHD